jgi:macrophage erythroblast attacher
MSASPSNISDIKALEQPSLKVPYEILNKKFRSAQKNIDREGSHVQVAVADLEAAMKSEVKDSAVASALLSIVIEKLGVHKRKHGESVTDELDAANVCKKRLEHLKEYGTKQTSNLPADVATVAQWKKTRLDRMLVEHFLRCGYYDTAIKLSMQTGIEDLTNIDLFLVSRQVEESLSRRETVKCLSWCYDNKSKLRKIRSNLEFNLRQQEFVELVRNNRRLDAVKHARKHFTGLEENQRTELQHAMGLLAFTPDTQVEPYRQLFDESRWASLTEQFRQENFKLFQLSSTSVFSVTLQSGLSALKTPQCYKKEGEKTPDCPVCSPLLNQLAASLPCAHCSQSRLICFMSGQPLNEHNQPMVLPNGFVYGEVSLKQMAIENGGVIVCPRTKVTYTLSDALKVYVM